MTAEIRRVGDLLRAVIKKSPYLSNPRQRSYNGFLGFKVNQRKIVSRRTEMLSQYHYGVATWHTQRQARGCEYSCPQTLPRSQMMLEEYLSQLWIWLFLACSLLRELELIAGQINRETNKEDEELLIVWANRRWAVKQRSVAIPVKNHLVADTWSRMKVRI